MEKNIRIRCRQTDVGMVENAITPALEEFKKATGRNVDIMLDKENFLAQET